MKISGFDWDDGNTQKCQKHGVSIGEIQQLFLSGDVWIMPDIKHSAAEERIVAIGKVAGRHMFVIYTIRGQRIRPVSARYMHQKEIDYYEKEKNA